MKKVFLVSLSLMFTIMVGCNNNQSNNSQGKDKSVVILKNMNKKMDDENNIGDYKSKKSEAELVKDSEITSEDMNELLNIVEEEKEKLSYDEAVDIEFKDKKVVITGTIPLFDKKEIAKYYPTMNIREKVNDYDFERTFILDGILKSWYISDEKIITQEQLGRTYKRELSNKTIKGIYLKYANELGNISISIFKDLSLLDKNKIEDDSTIELVEVNDKKYLLTKDKEDGYIKGIYLENEISDNTIGIQINIFERSPKTQKNETEIINMIETIDLNKFIKELDII